MVTRGALTDAMAIGYRPVCQSKPGLWPCYPIMPRFGLMGLGRTPNPVIPRYGLAALGQEGIFGTGIFSSIDPTTWSTGEWMLAIGFLFVGGFALYSMVHQTKQTGYRLEQRATRRRKKKAARLREKAKTLEAKSGGWF